MQESDQHFISEQIEHMSNIFSVRFDSIEALIKSEIKLSNHKLEILEQQSSDHEKRLRIIHDDVVRFKFFSSLYSGGSFIASIAAIIRSFFGGP